MIECPTCKLEFEKKSHHYQKYCSVECYSIAMNNRDRRRYLKRYRVENKNKISSKLKSTRTTFNYHISRMLSRIKKITSDTDISKEFLFELLEENNYCCKLTNIPFKPKNEGYGYHNSYAPSIDQIDPGQGYYKDNVMLILLSVNRAKGEMKLRDFISLLNTIIDGGKIDTNLVCDLHR